MRSKVATGKVHLVGSVPLENAEQVFRSAAVLGERISRIPDGETGARKNWIAWQATVFEHTPLFEKVPPEPGSYITRPRYRLRPGVTVDEIHFGPLGYAQAAKASYAIFLRLREEGVIRPGTKFQVSLPTPIAPVISYMVPEDQAKIEPDYEARLITELAEIENAIHHADLAIQWDTAIEFAILEGVMPGPFEDVKASVIERLVRLGKAVPGDVEMGFHLCYGDAGHKHFKEPEDTALLVEIANAISGGVRRTINWLHLPVPRERFDEEYYAPLRNLKLHPNTELYLGLVHFSDGVAGTQRRIEAASRVVEDFGVATECGMGRRPPETIADLLNIHAQIADFALAKS